RGDAEPLQLVEVRPALANLLGLLLLLLDLLLVAHATVSSLPAERLAHRVENAIDQWYRLFAAEGADQLDRLVDDDLGRRAGLAEQLVDRHPHHQPVDHRHPLQPPVLQVRGDQVVRFLDALDRPLHQVVGENPADLVHCRFGHEVGVLVLGGRRRVASRPVGADRLVRRDAPDFPLIEHLQRRLARATAAGPIDGAHARNPKLRGAVSDSLRYSAAISIAAAAASRPLLSGPGPDRAAACASSSVVSTPKAIGMPVSPAAAVMPCATAEAMWSKCGVSPRMMQPRQTMASKRPFSAATRAAC